MKRIQEVRLSVTSSDCIVGRFTPKQKISPIVDGQISRDINRKRLEYRSTRWDRKAVLRKSQRILWPHETYTFRHLLADHTGCQHSLEQRVKKTRPGHAIDGHLVYEKTGKKGPSTHSGSRAGLAWFGREELRHISEFVRPLVGGIVVAKGACGARTTGIDYHDLGGRRARGQRALDLVDRYGRGSSEAFTCPLYAQKAAQALELRPMTGIVEDDLVGIPRRLTKPFQLPTEFHGAEVVLRLFGPLKSSLAEDVSDPFRILDRRRNAKAAAVSAVANDQGDTLFTERRGRAWGRLRGGMRTPNSDNKSDQKRRCNCLRAPGHSTPQSLKTNGI